jgi:hypothetical protein
MPDQAHVISFRQRGRSRIRFRFGVPGGWIPVSRQDGGRPASAAQQKSSFRPPPDWAGGWPRPASWSRDLRTRPHQRQPSGNQAATVPATRLRNPHRQDRVMRVGPVTAPCTEESPRECD